MSDDDVTEFLTRNTHKSLKESERVIATWIREYELGTMEWCVVVKLKEEPIGSIAAVQDFPEMRYCELGYCIGKEYWGKGHMTEAVKAVTDYIFRNTDYLWVQARCDSENYGSRRYLEKCSFRHVADLELPDEKRGGEARTYHMMRTERKDVRLYANDK